METLREIFENHNGRLLNKWENYIDVYDTFFHKYRNKEIIFLEIGVAHGGSLEMWRKYFGEKARIVGVDVNPECKKFEEGNTKVYIGSQEDISFLEQLKKEIPKVDILVDDGGHTMKQQITTFKYLFDHVKDDGVYVCEDLHTSYWKDYGGGLHKPGTFIEFSKKFI
ncbi:MAG TPA: class I SAM-dependent methyltransferase, partial [Chitinophagaceae bacterium]